MLDKSGDKKVGRGPRHGRDLAAATGQVAGVATGQSARANGTGPLRPDTGPPSCRLRHGERVERGADDEWRGNGRDMAHVEVHTIDPTPEGLQSDAPEP